MRLLRALAGATPLPRAAETHALPAESGTVPAHHAVRPLVANLRVGTAIVTMIAAMTVVTTVGTTTGTRILPATGTRAMRTGATNRRGQLRGGIPGGGGGGAEDRQDSARKACWPGCKILEECLCGGEGRASVACIATLPSVFE